MKKILITFISGVMALMPAMAQTQRQAPALPSGVGPAMSGSADFDALPRNAQTFIHDLFPETAVAKVENDFADREYEVTMTDGSEVTFNYDGQWLQIEAPDGATLPSSSLTAIMPEDVVLTTLGSDTLRNGGVIDYVEEVTLTPEGYLVEYVAGQSGHGKANVSKADGSVLKAKCGKGYKSKAFKDKGGKCH